MKTRKRTQYFVKTMNTNTTRTTTGCTNKLSDLTATDYLKDVKKKVDF